jgi:hypothetical protein
MNNLHKITSNTIVPAVFKAFVHKFRKEATYRWNTRNNVLYVHNNHWVDEPDRWETCAMDKILEVKYGYEDFYTLHPELIPTNLKIIHE